MYRALDVVLPARPRTHLRTDGTVTLSDAGARLRGRLRSGRSRLLVANQSMHTQELRIYRQLPAPPDAAPRDRAGVDAGLSGSAAIGGVIGIPSGGEAVLAVTLEPGTYTMVYEPPPVRGGPVQPRPAAPIQIRIS
jgi:hypothetical protein